jgi:hypothetical protein
MDHRLGLTPNVLHAGGEALSKRKQLYLARHPETAKGQAQAQASNAVQGKGDVTTASVVTSFAQDTAAIMGKGVATVYQDVSIGEKFTDATKEVVCGSPSGSATKRQRRRARIACTLGRGSIDY